MIIAGARDFSVYFKVDPSDIVTHVLPLDQAKHGYEVFDTNMEDCIKVVLKP